MTTMFFQTTTEPKIDFSFENGQVTLYGDISSVCGNNSISGISKAEPNKYYYFKLQVSVPSSMRAIGTCSVGVEYYVEEHFNDFAREYNQIILSFPILDFFLANYLTRLTKNKNELIDCHEDEYQCGFEYHDLWLKFYSELENIADNYKPHYVGSGKLRVRSIQPFDSDFAFRVVERIRGLFSFIYSRKDISIGKVELISQHEYLRPKQIGHENDIYDNETHTLSIVSTLYLQELYNSSIAEIESFDPFKDICFCMLKDNIGQLISMAFKGKIMFYDLTKAEKNAYDLKHALWVNFCFEYYFDAVTEKFNDVILVGEDSYKVWWLDKLKSKLLYIFDPKCLVGKNVRLNIRKDINEYYPKFVTIDEVKGLNNNKDKPKWNGLKTILINHCSAPFEDLIKEYINFRDAHAHGDKKYDLYLMNHQNIINSIRLVEAMNYCMVLRLAEYSDEIVSVIIDNIIIQR